MKFGSYIWLLAVVCSTYATSFWFVSHNYAMALLCLIAGIIDTWAFFNSLKKEGEND